MELHVETRDEWRRWLAAHHRTATHVWLVSWKRATGRPAIAYGDAVEEALCFGWVDGIPGTVDGERAKRRFAPRKPASAWTAANRERAERMIDIGLMTEDGLAVVERARVDGSWDAHDPIEALTVPDDLAGALATVPGAAETFASFAPYLRRDILEWISAAKRADTRERRIAKTADAAGRGQIVSHSRPTRTRR